MLDFFRKYQRYFFIVITIVTIISFSFFGTYNSLGSNTWREQVAFKAIDGREVTRFEVDEMATFLATDNDDKLLYGGIWGPNFLNDGVIRKDFLETELARELVDAYQFDLQEDLQRRLEKEKKYIIYTHPQARFISVQNAWGYFVPEMNTYFNTLRSSQQAIDPDAFAARIKLFLAEKKFPAPTLKQVLRYQEKQYNSWLAPDQALNQTDLSLFGYHTLEDWFGPQFTRLVSQFIMNAAILAEQKGYHVSKAEVLADLVRNAELSYQQNKNKPYIGVTSSQEYLNEQLRRLNMDQSRALKAWRQVMLFRRYFHDIGGSALVDTLAYQKFHDFSQESLVLDLYRLPPALRFGDYASLQKFETYLHTVAKPSKIDSLALPTHFLAAADVVKDYPELVQKRYLLEVAHVNKKSLQTRVGMKETWDWEVNDDNWSVLEKQFPGLGAKQGKSREERFAILDDLDTVTRAKLDAFARELIVNAHPEWLQEAINEAKPKQMVIGLRLQGGSVPFEGVDTKEKRQYLIRLLDQSPLGDQPSKDAKLDAFTSDQQNYYRIKVIQRSPKPEILTFAEAYVDETLELIRDRLLEKYYEVIREQNPLLYQKEDLSWKEFKIVRDLIAEEYFGSIIKAIQQVHDDASLSKDQVASLRFYAHFKQAKEQLEKDPTVSSRWVMAKKQEEEQENQLEERPPLTDQWLLEQVVYHLNRKDQEEVVDTKEAFALPPEAWSEIKAPAHGDLSFFQMKERGANGEKEVAIATQTREAYRLLSADAQHILMRQVLKDIAAKKAISLVYLKTPLEEEGFDLGEESVDIQK